MCTPVISPNYVTNAGPSPIPIFGSEIDGLIDLGGTKPKTLLSQPQIQISAPAGSPDITSATGEVSLTVPTMQSLAQQMHSVSAVQGKRFIFLFQSDLPRCSRFVDTDRVLCSR